VGRYWDLNEAAWVTVDESAWVRADESAAESELAQPAEPRIDDAAPVLVTRTA